MLSTTTYRPGDLVLVVFPYSGGAQSKQRPALVVLDSGDADIVVARVTSQLYQTPHDVILADWRGAGLLLPSAVRAHKLATIEKALIRRRLGRLRRPDYARVAAVLEQLWRGW